MQLNIATLMLNDETIQVDGFEQISLDIDQKMFRLIEKVVKTTTTLTSFRDVVAGDGGVENGAEISARTLFNDVNIRMCRFNGAPCSFF